MKKLILSLALSVMLTTSFGQVAIKGVVKDADGVPLEGVVVQRYDGTGAVLTDASGEYIILAEKGDKLTFNYADAFIRDVVIKDEQLDLKFSNKDKPLSNRGAISSSRSTSSAISTVSGDELRQNSAMNVADALAGVMPGLLTVQNVDWDGSPTLYVRGGGSLDTNTPLVVVDGVKRSLSMLNMAEIESVSVLKDAAATAIWGVEGANGVIVVTTKRGIYNGSEVEINYTAGYSMVINQPEYVDGYTFAVAQNEALYYDGLSPMYTSDQLAAFKDGSNTDLYANTNWLEEGMRDYALSNQLDIAFRGGGEKLRYYTLINYKNDFGVLDESAVNNTEYYSTQMRKYYLSARVNLDVDITKTTKFNFSMMAYLNEKNMPNSEDSYDDYGIDDIIGYLHHTPSSAFPVKDSNGNWASSNTIGINPIAELYENGYFKRNSRLLQSDFRIDQDLSAITPGLSAVVGVSYDSSATYQEYASKTYSYSVASLVLDSTTGEYATSYDSYSEDTALSYSNSGLYDQYMRTVCDASVNYQRAFGDHSVQSLVQYRQDAYVPAGRNNSRHRQSIMYYGAYNYKDLIMGDLTMNYSGTSVLPEGEQFRFYPAASVALVASNLSGFDSDKIDYLKVRGSYGVVGSDPFGHDWDVQFWESDGSYYFGSGNQSYSGLVEGDIPAEILTLERSYKSNIGVDVQLFDNLFITADAFYDKRDQILIDVSSLYSTVLGTDVPRENVGAINTKGIELSAQWRGKIGRDFNYSIGGNLNFLDSEVVEDGQGYVPYDAMKTAGNPYGQIFGLEAIGFFNDTTDIENSPEQKFSTVLPGDIKYRDQNGDNMIDENDFIAIGDSDTIPSLYYGFNLSFEYKGFGLNAQFQGVSGISTILDTESVYRPMRNNEANLSTWYMEDNIRWTEDTKDTATLPRLSTLDNSNNNQVSTLWLRDASYFKLRNLNVYYNLPQAWVKSLNMSQLQVYLRAANLFSIDDIPYLNVEDLTVSYPDFTTFYLGVNFKF